MATENQLRKELVETARSFLGVKQGSKKHKEIIDIFNKVRPDGWAMTYSAPWCATFVSAMGIKEFGIKKAEMESDYRLEYKVYIHSFLLINLFS